MSIPILSLTLAYVFLLFVLLLAVFRSDLGVGAKLALVGASLGFYLWHYSAMQASLGWPAGARLPANFELVGRVTVEPGLDRNGEGAIYLWLRDLDRDELVPRAYRLPYFKELHRKVEKTMRRQQQGERFVGRPAAGGAGNMPDIEFESVQRDSGPAKTRSDP